jgi:hypothetical protein
MLEKISIEGLVMEWLIITHSITIADDQLPPPIGTLLG